MRKNLILNYLVIAAIIVVAVCTSCGNSGGSGNVGNGGSSSSSGKKLSGTYDGYLQVGKTTFTFSGNRIKIDVDKEVVIEGSFELVEEYQDDDFSRGIIIITHRDGEFKGNYTLEGKKREILTVNRMDYSYKGFHFPFDNIYIKGGKSNKIPGGTYSSTETLLGFGIKMSLLFSGNNLIRTDPDSNGNNNNYEYTYEFIVGYENKGISKGYLLMKSEYDPFSISCSLEKDKLTLDWGVYTKE